MLNLAELEALRDDLAERVEHARRALCDRTYVEEQHRRRIEEMLLEPEKHKWVRIGNEDIGEPGCKHWHVSPRWGVLGMLMNWWRVRISSGCPLGHLSIRMGKRSRKRAAATGSPAAATSTRAERDAARRERARQARQNVAAPAAKPRPGRTSIDDRPPPVWGSVPPQRAGHPRRHRADGLGFPLRPR